MAEYLIDIHLPGPNRFTAAGLQHDDRLNSYGRIELGQAIANLGATVSYSRDGGERNPETGLPFAHIAEFGHVAGVPAVFLDPKGTRFENVDAVRNITKALGANTPEINPIAVREFARDKVISNQLLTDIGAGKSFAEWNTGMHIAAALDRIVGDDIVMKPRHGKRSEGVHATTKREALQLFANGQLDTSKDWVIEERLGLALPVGIRGRDTTQQAKIDEANRLGIPKELRAYCFGRESGRIVTSYLMRVAKKGETSLGNDGWVFIDTDSVPNEAQEHVEKGLAELEMRTGHRSMNVAFDFVRTQLHGESEARWIGMEINGTEPQLVTPKEDLAMGAEHAKNMAGLLYRVAQAGGTK